MRVLVRRHTDETPWHYADAVQFQQDIIKEIQAGAPGIALLSEFAPVITLGRGHRQDDFKLPVNQIHENEVEVLEVDRGGRATYHGPGQWTLFMLDHLENLVGEKMGVKKMVNRLLQTAQKTCEKFDVLAEERAGAELGLWIPEKSQKGIPGKVSSVGIRVARGLVTHGVALNGCATSKSFFGIHPCGISGAKPGFLFQKQDQNLFDELGQELLCQASEVFNVDFEFDGDFARKYGVSI